MGVDAELPLTVSSCRELVLCCNVLYPKGLPPHGEGLKLKRSAMGGANVAFPVASLPIAFTV